MFLILNSPTPPAVPDRQNDRLSDPRPRRRPVPSSADRRRGAVTVLGVVLIASLMALVAFAADFGHINVARSEVKRTADAAAMSACWELFDGVIEGQEVDELNGPIGDVAAQFAAANTVASRAPVLNPGTDLEIGKYSLDNPGHLDTSDPEQFNAVRVHVRQTNANSSSVPLFFGSVTGRHEQSMQASSTAALFKTISGFYAPPRHDQTLDILPIALDLETWEQVVAKSTEDRYTCSGGSVGSGSDGYYECSLYPTGTGSPGNRGTVDIGGSNNSTKDLKRQILHGISKSDMDALGKDLVFDHNGELTLNGDTGISAGIKAQLKQIIGQPRVIPIFTEVHGNGNNAMYTIVRFEGIRILSVRLTGPMKKKHVTIQPAPMLARHAINKFEEEKLTNFLYTPVMLVE